MDYSRVKIGELNFGIDGYDVYYKCTVTDENVTGKEFRKYLNEVYQTNSSYPGSSYCDGALVMDYPFTDNTFIVVIRYRYDN